MGAEDTFSSPPFLLLSLHLFERKEMQSILINSVHIREDRQRKDLGDLKDLKASLLNVGLLNPIIIEQDTDGLFYLIAGERRYTAWKELVEEGLLSDEIPCKVLSDLDQNQRFLIELEENIKRKDLTWQEYCEAIDKMYDIKGCSSNSELAEYIGISEYIIQRARQIWANRDNPRVLAADNMAAALTICKRENARKLEAVKNSLDHSMMQFLFAPVGQENNPVEEESLFEETQVTAVDSSVPAVPSVPPLSSSSSSARIICADFKQWAEEYRGKKFNLLHLDFPYGINHDRSGQGHTKDFGTYADTEDIYKDLVRTLLSHEDNIISSSAHVICWLSLRYAEWTKKAFEEHGFSCLVQPFIWYKSDNKGIIADVQCGMRNVGEYALIFNKGRYPVLKNISNIFPSQTTKKFHASEKPIPMLDYLFTAFVDNKTRLLDPTCGSGTSVISAMKAGAEEALGIEMDSEFASKAQSWLDEEWRKEEAKKSLNINLGFEK